MRPLIGERVSVCGPIRTRRATGLLAALEAWKSTAATQWCFHNNQPLPCRTGPSSTNRVSTSSPTTLFAQRIAFPKHTREGGVGFTPGELPAKPLPHAHTDTRNWKEKTDIHLFPDPLWVGKLGTRFMLQDEMENQVLGGTWRGNCTEGYGRTASLALRIGLHPERRSCSNIHTLHHNIPLNKSLQETK